VMSRELSRRGVVAVDPPRLSLSSCASSPSAPQLGSHGR
jgi:hypothetical protein